MCLGIPGRVVAITDETRKLGRVDVAGVQREINLVCVAEPGAPLEDCIGQWVLVHVGFAMSRIDEAEAAATLQILKELGEVQEQLAAMRDSAAEPGELA